MLAKHYHVKYNNWKTKMELIVSYQGKTGQLFLTQPDKNATKILSVIKEYESSKKL
jgi:hypothetical protein